MSDSARTESPEMREARKAVIARAMFGYSSMSSGSQTIIARANMEEINRRYKEYLATLSTEAIG